MLIDSSTKLAISGGWSADCGTRDPVANRTIVLGVLGAPPPFTGVNFSDAR